MRRLWMKVLETVLEGTDVLWQRPGLRFTMRRMAGDKTVMGDPSTWYAYVSVRKPDESRNRYWRIHLGKEFKAFFAKYLRENQDKVFEYKHSRFN